MNTFDDLRKLEGENKFLFHGSGYPIEELEPRQAYTHESGTPLADGPPAVFATPFLDYAVFMSIFNRANCERLLTSSCDFKDGQLMFGATIETLEQVSKASGGHVHVFNRFDFEQRNEFEWICTRSIRPVFVIETCRQDFTCTIQLIERRLVTAD